MVLSFPLPDNQKRDKGKENQTVVDGQGPRAVSPWTGNVQDPAQAGKSSISGSLDQGHMGGDSSGNNEGDPAYPASISPGGEGSYETQVENRVKNLFKFVDEMGKVGITVVLKSSSEKVVRVDRSTSSSTAQEKDSGGGARETANSQPNKSTVLPGSDSDGSGNMPIIEKELSPEASGIIISTEGGGSPTVKAEISGVMEALFSLSLHRIKILKRAE